MAVNYKRLVESYQRLPGGEANSRLREAFAAGEIRAGDIELGRLFAECFGHGEYLAFKGDKSRNVNEFLQSRLREAGGAGAVTTAAFANINYQIVYSAFMEKYKAEDLVFQNIIPEMDTMFLDGEKIAGLTEVGDRLAVRPETYPYTIAGPGENWIFAPPVQDRGMEIPVTWEAIFMDRTGRLLDYCRDVGKWAGLNREKRAIDCVLDLYTTRHRYNWRGTVIQSYGANSGSHTWDNLATSNALVDWTTLNTAEQKLNQITDPFTGEPVDLEAEDIIVAKGLEHTAERVIRATEIEVMTPGYATSGNPTRTKAPNPYTNRARIITSRYVLSRATLGGGLSTDWFYGSLRQYARYAVAERMAVAQMPPNSIDEFRRRIVTSFRVNERGAYFVFDPRYLVKNTA